MSYKSYALANPNRCQCGRHWDDHIEMSPKCTNCDGEGEINANPPRECPVCKGRGWLPCAGEPGDDGCYRFVQDETTNAEAVADELGW